MDDRPSIGFLMRETLKSATAGLFGGTVPGLLSLRGGDLTTIHAMRDVAVGLAIPILFNTLMSTLVPAVLTLRRTGAYRHLFGARPWALAVPAAVVLGLAVAGTITTLAVLHLVSLAFSLRGVAAPGIMLIRAAQAVLVAVILTPLTIVIFSGR